MSQNRPDNDNTTTGGAGGGTTGAGGTSSGAGGTSSGATGDPSQWGARTAGGAGGAGTGAATGLAGDAGTSTGLSTTPGGGEGGGGIADTARQYGQKAAEYGQQAKEFLGERFSGVGDRIQDLRNKDYGQMAEEAKDYARQNPGQALLVAAAAGFVLGLLLRGGRR